MDRATSGEPAGQSVPEGDRQRCEVWTRVMGYYRPVSAWNAGKQSEYSDRTPYHQTPAAIPDTSGQRKLGI